MLIIAEYEWKDYGIFFDISFYFPVCLKIFIRKTKMKEQSPFPTELQQNDIFSKHIYFSHNSYRKKDLY